MTPSALSTTLLVLICTLQSSARPIYPARIPNGANVPNHPALGHVNDVEGGTNNKFGLDFANAGYRWTNAFCNLDSDGDGFSNGYELGDPQCLWTTTNRFPIRATDLTHPGLASSRPASSSPTTLRPTSKAPTSKSPTTPRPTAAPTTLSPTATSSPTAPTPPTVPTSRAPSRNPTSMPTTSPTATPSATPSFSTPSTSPETSPVEPPDNTGSEGGGSQAFSTAYEFKLWIGHAVIMSLAFGLLMPVGIMIPAITPLRKLSGGIWFKIHRAIQVVAVLLAWIGFIIALITIAMADRSLSGVLDTSPTVHGPLGIAIMVIVSFQTLLGVFRPHLPSAGNAKSKLRLVFEFVHPWIGRGILIIAVVQMFFGFRLLSDNYIASEASQSSIMAWAYFQAIATPIIVVIVVLYFKVSSWLVARGSSPVSVPASKDDTHHDAASTTPTSEDVKLKAAKPVADEGAYGDDERQQVVTV